MGPHYKGKSHGSRRGLSGHNGVHVQGGRQIPFTWGMWLGTHTPKSSKVPFLLSFVTRNISCYK